MLKKIRKQIDQFKTQVEINVKLFFFIVILFFFKLKINY